MADPQPPITIVEQPIETPLLARLVAAWFGDMVKLVVDVGERKVAVGGELHADAEQLLLERGSRQTDLWGANYYPGGGADACIEYTALINIRPAQANPSMEIQNPELREKVQGIVFELIGEGEDL